MSDRSAMLIFTCESEAFALATMVEALASIRLSLTFPGSGVVKVLDEVGEQHDVLPDDLASSLRTEAAICFQWWWNECEDVFCGIELVSDVALVDFGLDGLNHSQETELLTCVRGIYDILAERELALGFLVDRTGNSLLNPWYDILKGSDVIRGEFPDELVVPRRIGERILRELPYPINVQENENCLVLTPYYSGPTRWYHRGDPDRK